MTSAQAADPEEHHIPSVPRTDVGPGWPDRKWKEHCHKTSLQVL